MNAVFAGFWRRAAALFVDFLILLIPQSVVNLGLASMPTLAMLINVALSAAYFVAFHSSARMATPGKMALGIGYLMAAFTERKQALHDMLCKTVVINKAVTPADIGENTDTMPVTAGV